MQIDDKTKLILRPLHQQTEHGVATVLLLHTEVSDQDLVDADGKPEQHAWAITGDMIGAVMDGHAVVVNHAVKDPGIVRPTVEAVQKVTRTQ